MKKWYQSWFDSPYYHILYKDRNQDEAKIFIDHLIAFLKPHPESRMLDQACGKGRHAKYLNSLGFEVTGIDLSPQSIAYCKKFENEKLEFFVHDMRKVFRINYYDYVFNLFTSFGYFENDHQHQLTIDSAAQSLKKGGLFIIDFMNVNKVLRELKAFSSVVKENIQFDISKKVENGFIIKTITFTDKETEYLFNEKVEIIYEQDFERYFLHSGLKIVNVSGNYNLEPFDELNSDRLILIAEKI
jgi:SAM-dependent methyltransferase